MKAKTIAAIAVCGFFAACGGGDDKRGALDQEKETVRQGYVEGFQTPQLESAEKLGVNDFYLALRVNNDINKSSISTCVNRDKLKKAIKSVVGVSGNEALAVVVSVKRQNKDLVSEYPVYITGVNDDPGEGEDGCYSQYYSGNITPYFRHDANLNFEVTYAVKYADNVTVEAAGRIFEASKRIAGVSGSAGFAVSSLASMLIEPGASVIDKASGDAFSVARSRDVGTEVISMEPDLGTPAMDGLKISLGSVVPGVPKNATISIALTYRPSLIAVQRTNGLVYGDDPDNILSSIMDAKKSQSLLDIVNEGAQFIANPRTMRLWDDAEEKAEVVAYCGRLRTYLANELQLTPDDALVARWAVMKRYSQYDKSEAIRTEYCFTTPNTGNPDKNDIERLMSLNKAFVFDKTTTELNALIDRKVAELATPLTIGTAETFYKYFDLENFAIVVPNKLKLLPTSFQDRVDNVSGVSAGELMKELFTQGFCAASQKSGEGTLLHLALFLRVDPKFKDEHPYMRDVNNNPILPVVMDLNPASWLVKTVYILEIDSMSGFKIPDAWPYHWNVDSCSDYLPKPDASVGSYS